MTIHQILLFILASLSGFGSLFSQSTDCSVFEIYSVVPDTSNSISYQIAIHYSADSQQIISYPHVSAVLDCHGDTVATGSLFYFGQLGATTQDYPVMLTGNGSMTCFPLTSIFIYGNDTGGTDTCYLSFGAVGVQDFKHRNDEYLVYPNPTSHTLHIANLTELVDFRVLDLSGKTVLCGTTSGGVNVENLNTGFYFLEIATFECGRNELFYKN